MKTDLPRTRGVQFTPAHLQSLTDPSSGVVEEQKKGAISKAVWRVQIHLIQDQAKLLWVQIVGLSAWSSFGWQGKDASILVGMRLIIAQQVLDPTPQRCQPSVASHGSITATSFQIH